MTLSNAHLGSQFSAGRFRRFMAALIALAIAAIVPTNASASTNQANIRQTVAKIVDPASIDATGIGTVVNVNNIAPANFVTLINPKGGDMNTATATEIVGTVSSYTRRTYTGTSGIAGAVTINPFTRATSTGAPNFNPQFTASLNGAAPELAGAT